MRRVAMLAALVVVLLAPMRADAQTALGGVRGSASASGLHALYTPQGLLPIASPVDLGSPDALATIASGPSTFARAAVADPGDLLANPDALLTLFSSDYPSGTVPPWPFRITASSSLGQPTAESNPAPGLSARVDATSQGSRAWASMPGGSVPAVATAESVISEATTRTDGSSVTVRAVSRTTGFDLLGLVKIESIVTDLTATASAAGRKLTGRTIIGGATVMGQAVTIDAGGVHPDGGGSGGSGTGALNEVLRNAGIRITVAEPTKIEGSTGGQRTAAGVRVDLEISPRTFPAISTILGMLPPIENPIPGAPSVEDVLELARARHLSSLHIAGASVTLETREGATFGPAPLPPIDSLLPSLTPAGPTAFDGELPLPGPAGSLTPVRPSAPASTSAAIPAGSSIAGLVLLALLIQPLLGARLSSAAATILDAGGPTSCTTEQP